MNTTITKLASAAHDMIRMHIKNVKTRGNFRSLFTLTVDGSPMPVLIVGVADGNIEDGQAIAILNPDEELQGRLDAGVGYSGGLLKEIVSGKCDAMVHVWLDAYKAPLDGEIILDKYSPRSKFGPAKFTVR